MDAPRNVHAVRLFIVEPYPSLEIPEYLEGVVTQLIPAIVVGADTSQLGLLFSTFEDRRVSGELTADTRLLTWARTSGCTMSMVPSANSMIATYQQTVDCCS